MAAGRGKARPGKRAGEPPSRPAGSQPAEPFPASLSPQPSGAVGAWAAAGRRGVLGEGRSGAGGAERYAARCSAGNPAAARLRVAAVALEYELGERQRNGIHFSVYYVSFVIPCWLPGTEAREPRALPSTPGMAPGWGKCQPLCLPPVWAWGHPGGLGVRWSGAVLQVFLRLGPQK